MDTVPLPSGRFTYGPRGAVVVEVVHLDSGRSGLQLVSDPSVWEAGSGFTVHLNPDELLREAAALGFDPIRYAHWYIACQADWIVIGKAYGKYNFVLTGAQPPAKDAFDLLDSEAERKVRLRMASVLAVELVQELIPYHTDLVRDREEEEAIRLFFLSTAYVKVETAPLTESGRILGDVGRGIRRLMLQRISPWMRAVL